MKLSIRSKLTTASGLLVAVVVVMFAVVMIQMVRGDLENDRTRVSQHRQEVMRQTGLLLTENVAQSSITMLAGFERQNLIYLANQLVASQTPGVEILNAAILDQRGQEVASPENSDAPEFDPEIYGLDSLVDIVAARVFERAENPSDWALGNFIVVAPIESVRPGPDEQSEPLVQRHGYALIEFGPGPLMAELAEIDSGTERRIEDIQRNIIILGGLAILLGILISIIQSLRITNPILRLAVSAEKVASGDFGERANVKSQDEIGILARSFNNLAERIQLLMTETRQKATLEKELEVARVIQETLLPPSGVVDREPLQIFGYFRSASVCGGDFWNVIDLDDGRTLVVIGDVTGHGVPSAMITASAKSSLDTIRNIRGKNLSLTFLLEEMNKTIFASAKRKFVMTFFAITYDRARNELHYSNAGHNFPFLVRKENGKLEVKGLVARGNRLGDVENSRYVEHKMPIKSGDLIALYTDGLTEYRNDDGVEYTEKRFRRMLQKCYALSAEEIGKAILRDLSQFANQAPQEDDVSLVIVKVGQILGPQRHPLPVPPKTN